LAVTTKGGRRRETRRFSLLLKLDRKRRLQERERRVFVLLGFFLMSFVFKESHICSKKKYHTNSQGKGIPKIETAHLNDYNGTIIPIMQFFGLKCPSSPTKKILMVHPLKKNKKKI
jgi:hypothetical protein